MDGKIIQIMPAPQNLFVVYDDEGKEIEVRAVCIALTDQGEMDICDIDRFGYIDTVSQVSNLKGIKWR